MLGAAFIFGIFRNTQGGVYLAILTAWSSGQLVITTDNLPTRYHCPGLFEHDNDYLLSVSPVGEVVCSCGHSFGLLPVKLEV